MAVLRGPFDLAGLRLAPGSGTRLEVEVPAPGFSLGGHDYSVEPDPVPVRVDVSRTIGEGWAFKLSFTAGVRGPCTRCLAPAGEQIEVESREADRPGGGEELESPYLDGELLDIVAWTSDALLLALPSSILCIADCKGLCPECGERIADLEPGHAHERPPDPRWDALRRLSE